MQIIHFLIDFVLHIDHHLVTIVNMFGNWTYVILFLIVFIETGAVVLPFLPGDSLLFAAAALAASVKYNLNIWLFIGVFLTAAILGDSLNFFLGSKVGEALVHNRFFGKFVKQKDLDKARHFFDKYGAFAIFFGRFMPIIRTFVPFVAAGSEFNYKKFLKFNIIACISWVLVCCGAGYFFGNIPFVQNHFSMVILLIIAVSLLPIIIGVIKSKVQIKKTS